MRITDSFDGFFFPLLLPHTTQNLSPITLVGQLGTMWEVA